MRRPLLALSAAVALTASPAAAGADAARGGDRQRPTSYVLPGEAVFPEGIAFHRRTRSFFVSSTIDGTIFRGTLREPTASVFLPPGEDGRTTAIGLKAHRNRLYVAGGGTGKMWVYDIRSREMIASFDNDLPATFVNDVVVTRTGDAYFTDSLSPYLYRVARSDDGALRFERFLDFTGSPLVYTTGFNLNGIAASRDGRFLVVVQSNTGRLFRIEVATRRVREIDLGGVRLTAGDGLLLEGRTLYVVRNALEQIVEVRLGRNLRRGRVVSTTTDPSFAFPTTIARAGGRLLVVNSQFDRRAPGLAPELPFTVSAIRVP
jgi:Cu-Zn family superoxide dismutase